MWAKVPLLETMEVSTIPLFLGVFIELDGTKETTAAVAATAAAAAETAAAATKSAKSAAGIKEVAEAVQDDQKEVICYFCGRANKPEH